MAIQLPAGLPLHVRPRMQTCLIHPQQQGLGQGVGERAKKHAVAVLQLTQVVQQSYKIARAGATCKIATQKLPYRVVQVRPVVEAHPPTRV